MSRDEDAADVTQTVSEGKAPQPRGVRASPPPDFFAVEIVGGPLDGLRRRVHGGVLRIGRSTDNDLVLGHDKMISSRHARLVREGESCWIEDLGSRNGVFVGSERVEGRYRVNRGSLVLVGRTRFEVLSD